GGMRSVTRLHHHGIDGVTWSPDGKWLAFGNAPDAMTFNFRLSRIRPDGTGLRSITHGPGAFDHDPDWSPDGRWIVFQRDPQIYRVRASGGPATLLAGGWDPAGRFADAEPVWSSSGDRIAWLSGRHPSAGCIGFTVYLMNRNGGAVKPLTCTSDEDDYQMLD